MKKENFLRHCYETEPYYNDLFKQYNVNVDNADIVEELKKLPPLSKELIITDTRRFLSSKYDPNKLIKEYTSGSTGEPATIYKSYLDKVSSGKALWKFREEEYGIKSSDFYVRFHMAAVNEKDEAVAQRVIFRDNSLSFSLLHLNDEDIAEYYELLKKYSVKWIFGAPSAILLIAKYIKKNNLPPVESLKYIEVSGEFQTEAAKLEIESVFNCKVGDLYGLREVYGVALSCKKNKLHIINDNVIINVVDDDGNEIVDNGTGNLLITSLNNTAMPLIKYVSGDRAEVIKNYKCDCGRCGDVIKLSSGRVTDYVKIGDDRIISSCVFYLAVGEMNIIYKNLITQFQVVEKNSEEYVLKLVVSSNRVSREELEKSFLGFITSFGMPERKWSFEFVNNIEIDKRTGKHRYFIKSSS